MNDLQEQVRRFMLERNWNDQPLEDIAKSIVIEAAELLEHFQWSAFRGDEKISPEKRQEIIDELADVFVYAAQMSCVLGVNAHEIVQAKLARAAKKYPAAEIISLGSKRYDEIKKEYRTKKD